MTLQDDLKRLLDEHRRKAYIVCEESCFCWEISAFLEKNQENDEIIRRFIEKDHYYGQEFLVAIPPEGMFTYINPHLPPTESAKYVVLVYKISKQLGPNIWQYEFSGARMG